METYRVFGLMAVGAAFLAAFLACRWAQGRLSRVRTGSLSTRSDSKDGAFARALRNGVPGCTALARHLRSLGGVNRFARDAVSAAEGAGYTATEDAIVSAVVFAAIGSFAVGLAVSGTLAGAAAAACCVVLVSSWVRSRQEHRVEQMRESVPDVLRSMRACFQSGLSLLQTLEQVGSEAKGSVGMLFSRGAHTLRTGGTSSEALSSLRTSRIVPELAFVAIALDVQHQTGGSMAHVLDAARDMAESELELARSMRVHTAQARLSARVVSVMPFVLVALFSLVSNDFLAPFFESAAGVALLAIALLLQGAGVIAIRKTLRVGDG